MTDAAAAASAATNGGAATAAPVNKVPGLAVTRAIHYHPLPQERELLGLKPDDASTPIAGVISAVDNLAAGLVTAHLYSLGEGYPVHASIGKLRFGTVVAVASGVAYDESAKPGTWRFPPRV